MSVCRFSFFTSIILISGFPPCEKIGSSNFCCRAVQLSLSTPWLWQSKRRLVQAEKILDLERRLAQNNTEKDKEKAHKAHARYLFHIVSAFKRNMSEDRYNMLFAALSPYQNVDVGGTSDNAVVFFPASFKYTNNDLRLKGGRLLLERHLWYHYESYSSEDFEQLGAELFYFLKHKFRKQKSRWMYDDNQKPEIEMMESDDRPQLRVTGHDTASQIKNGDGIRKKFERKSVAPKKRGASVPADLLSTPATAILIQNPSQIKNMGDDISSELSTKDNPDWD